MSYSSEQLEQPISDPLDAAITPRIRGETRVSRGCLFSADAADDSLHNGRERERERERET